MHNTTHMGVQKRVMAMSVWSPSSAPLFWQRLLAGDGTLSTLTSQTADAGQSVSHERGSRGRREQERATWGGADEERGRGREKDARFVGIDTEATIFFEVGALFFFFFFFLCLFHPFIHSSIHPSIHPSIILSLHLLVTLAFAQHPPLSAHTDRQTDISSITLLR